MSIVTSSAFFPPVKPSAIAVGTVFSHASSFVLGAPVFGDAFQKAQESKTGKEFAESKEAASAGALYGASLLGAGAQSYATAALIKLTGAKSFKAAAYLGGLVFAITSLPNVVNSLLIEKKKLDLVVATVVTQLVDSVGLASLLVWWGVDDSPISY